MKKERNKKYSKIFGCVALVLTTSLMAGSVVANTEGYSAFQCELDSSRLQSSIDIRCDQKLPDLSATSEELEGFTTECSMFINADVDLTELSYGSGPDTRLLAETEVEIPFTVKTEKYRLCKLGQVGSSCQKVDFDYAGSSHYQLRFSARDIDFFSFTYRIAEQEAKVDSILTSYEYQPETILSAKAKILEGFSGQEFTVIHDGGIPEDSMRTVMRLVLRSLESHIGEEDCTLQTGPLSFR